MSETAKEDERGLPLIPCDELRYLKLMEYAVARAPQAVMAVDWTNGGAQLSITYVNDAFTRIFGYTWGEAINRSPTMLCGPRTDRDVLNKGLKKVLRDGGAAFDVVHYRKDGQPIWLEIVVIPVVDANGAITATLSYLRERKDLSMRMEAAPAQNRMPARQAGPDR